MAGSIPTEFGELINLTELDLQQNKLSGTPSLPILPCLVVRAKDGGGGRGGGGGSAGGVATGVASHGARQNLH
jgi:hypothetical protein